MRLFIHFSGPIFLGLIYRSSKVSGTKPWKKEIDMIRAAVIFVTFLLSTGVYADTEFVCTAGDAERVISVVYFGDGLVPCEVRYDKGTGADVLWTAQNEEGYCENQARQFVGKQEGWGFSCSETMEESE